MIMDDQSCNANARVTMGNRQRNSTSIRAFAHEVVAEFDRLFNSADRERPYRQPPPFTNIRDTFSPHWHAG